MLMGLEQRCTIENINILLIFSLNLVDEITFDVPIFATIFTVINYVRYAEMKTTNNIYLKEIYFIVIFETIISFFFF